MSLLRECWPRGPRLVSALGVTLLLLLLGLAAPRSARAHPLDELLQATYITVGPSRIEVEIDLTPGVLVAPRILNALDPDGDQTISEAEGRAYAEDVLRSVDLRLDGRPLALAITRVDRPSALSTQAGYGTIRIFAAAPLPAGMAGTHRIDYENAYAPVTSAYQVNAFVERGVAITLGKQNRDAIQQRVTMDYAIEGGPAAAEPLAAPVETLAGAPGQASTLLASLAAPVLSPWRLLLALGLAGVLGGLHAMTPGHGKTLVAAYLVGSRGTVRHAVALGALVTFTHTASVIAIGLLALFASQVVAPDALGPILEIGSGALVVALGARLVWQRWAAWRPGAEHTHTHGHEHGHGAGHAHAHLPPAGDITPGSLIAMGVAGGLVPCPEALGIMIIAIGLNRILLGLGLIVSFSFGLAAVLMVLGMVLVRSRALIERAGALGGHWSGRLQFGSAVLVTALGIGMTLNGLAAWFG